MPTRLMRSSTSPGPGWGSGRSITASEPGASQRRAFMVALLLTVRRPSIHDKGPILARQLIENFEDAVEMIFQALGCLVGVAPVERVNDRRMLGDDDRKAIRLAEEPHEAGEPRLGAHHRQPHALPVGETGEGMVEALVLGE